MVASSAITSKYIVDYVSHYVYIVNYYCTMYLRVIADETVISEILYSYFLPSFFISSMRLGYFDFYFIYNEPHSVFSPPQC